MIIIVHHFYLYYKNYYSIITIKILNNINILYISLFSSTILRIFSDFSIKLGLNLNKSVMNSFNWFDSVN
jgi:hypothetical protein